MKNKKIVLINMKILKKALCAFVAGVFLFNDIAYAADFRNLAPRTGVTLQEFRDRYLSGYILLSHKAINSYIDTYLSTDSSELTRLIQAGIRWDKIIVRCDGSQDTVNVRIVPVKGLLKNTGQLAHIGLGNAKNIGSPSIYVDYDYRYDEDLLANEKEKISKWEGKRRELGKTYSEMRRWIQANPENARALAAEFHRSSRSISHLYEDIKKRYRVALDADNLEECQRILDFDQMHEYFEQFGLDEGSGDANLAASPEEVQVKPPDISHNGMEVEKEQVKPENKNISSSAQFTTPPRNIPSYFLERMFVQYRCLTDKDADFGDRMDALDWFRRIEIVRIKQGHKPAILKILEKDAAEGMNLGMAGGRAISKINIAMLDHGEEPSSLPFLTIELLTLSIRKKPLVFTNLAKAVTDIYIHMINTSKGEKVHLDLFDKLFGFVTRLNLEELPDDYTRSSLNDIIECMGKIDTALVENGMDPHYASVIVKSLSRLPAIHDDVAYEALTNVSIALIKQKKPLVEQFDPEELLEDYHGDVWLINHNDYGSPARRMDLMEKFILAAIGEGRVPGETMIRKLQEIAGSESFIQPKFICAKAQGILKNIDVALVKKGLDPVSVPFFQNLGWGAGEDVIAMCDNMDNLTAGLNALTEIDSERIKAGKEMVSHDFLSKMFKTLYMSYIDINSTRSQWKLGIYLPHLVGLHVAALLEIDIALKNAGKEAIFLPFIEDGHKYLYRELRSVLPKKDKDMGKDDRPQPDTNETRLKELLADLKSGADISCNDVIEVYKGINYYAWKTYPRMRELVMGIDEEIITRFPPSPEEERLYALWLQTNLPPYQNIFEEYVKASDPQAFIAAFDDAKPIEDDAYYGLDAYYVSGGDEQKRTGIASGRELRELILKRNNDYLKPWTIRTYPIAALPKSDRAGLPAYKELIKCSLIRYGFFAREERAKFSFIAEEIIRIAESDNREEFEALFRTIVSLISENKDFRVCDVSVIFGDIFMFRPNLKYIIYTWLNSIAAISDKATVQESETALKVIRGAEVGQIVLVAPESNWKNNRLGGVALYITDLAKNLSEMGIDVTVVNPLFRNEFKEVCSKYGIDKTRSIFDITYGANDNERTTVFSHEAIIDGVRVIFLSNYDFMDSMADVLSNEWKRLRFSRLMSQGTLDVIRKHNIYPAVITTNGSDSSYIGVYLKRWYMPYRLDGINLSDDPHFSWTVGGERHDTQFVSVHHHLFWSYQGVFYSDSVNMSRDRLIHDLRVDPSNPMFYTPESSTNINPIHASLSTADELIFVSHPFLNRVLASFKDPEFGGLARYVFQLVSNGLKKVVGIPNGFDLAARQKDFFHKMLSLDEEVRKNINKDLEIRRWDPEEKDYREFLGKLISDPEFSNRSLLEIGNEKERRLFARAIFEYVSPVQQIRLQKAVGLKPGNNKFIYSMLHRIIESKGQQLLFNTIWDTAHPDKLHNFPEQLFENMNLESRLSSAEQYLLALHARRYGLERFTTIDVVMALMPNAQIIVAGNIVGQERRDYGDSFRALAGRYPGRVVYIDRFIDPSDPLYELIYSGSSVFGMPSRWEPSGLAQREAHAYGVPSLTTKRDGLLDTLLTARWEGHTLESGFGDFNPVAWYRKFDEMWTTVSASWNQALWDELRYQAITQDNRWLNSAKQYLDEFRELTGVSRLPQLPALEVLTAYNIAKKEGHDYLDVFAAAGYTSKESVLAALKTAIVASPQKEISKRVNEIKEYLGTLPGSNSEVSPQIARRPSSGGNASVAPVMLGVSSTAGIFVLAGMMTYLYLATQREKILEWLAIRSNRLKWYSPIFKALQYIVKYTLLPIPKPYLAYILPILGMFPVTMTVSSEVSVETTAPNSADATKVQELIRGLKNEDREVRKDAAQALGDMGPAAADAIWELCNLIRRKDHEPLTDNSGPSASARDALIRIGPASIPHLIWHLKDPANPDRKPFATALSAFGDAAHDAVPVLVSIINDKDFQKTNEWYRNAMVGVLGRVGRQCPEALPTLIKVMETDPDGNVVATAAGSINEVLGLGSIRFFIERISSTDNTKPSHELDLYYSTIMRHGLEAIPVLEKLKAENKDYEAIATNCIKKIATDKLDDLLQYARESAFGSNSSYDAALCGLFNWTQDELKERWTDLQELALRHGSSRFFETPVFFTGIHYLKEDFGDKETIVWPGYAKFMKQETRVNIYYDTAIRSLARFFKKYDLNSDDLFNFAQDLIEMGKASNRSSDFTNYGLPLMISHIECFMSSKDGLASEGKVRVFRDEWANCVNVVKALGPYCNSLKNSKWPAEYIFSLKIPEIEKMVLTLNDFLSKLKDVKHDETAQQTFNENELLDSCMLDVFKLNLILPGFTDYFIRVVYESQLPLMALPLINRIKPILDDEDIMSAFSDLLGRLKAKSPDIYTPDINAFLEIFDMLAVLKTVTSVTKTAEFLRNISLVDINPENIGEAPSLFTRNIKRAINPISHMCTDAQTDKLYSIISKRLPKDKDLLNRSLNSIRNMGSSIPVDRLIQYLDARDKDRTIDLIVLDTDHGGVFERHIEPFLKTLDDEERAAFLGNILPQAAYDIAVDSSGEVSHRRLCRTIEIMQNAYHPLSKWKQGLRDYPFDDQALTDMQADLIKNGQWLAGFKQFERLNILIGAIQNKRMYEKLKRFNDGTDSGARITRYYRYLISHPNMVDYTALAKMIESPQEFLGINDGPSDLHEMKKPSQLLELPFIDLKAEELMKGLILGQLDAIQAIRPFSVTIDASDVDETMRSLSGGELVKYLVERKFTDEETMRDLLREFFSRELWSTGEAGDSRTLRSRQKKAKLALQFIEKNAAFGSIVNILADSRFDIKALTDSAFNTRVLPSYTASIIPKSSPQAIMTGTEVPTCMSFGSGKNNIYVFNPNCAFFTLSQKVIDAGQARDRILTTSVITLDRHVPHNVANAVKAIRESSIENVDLPKIMGPNFINEISTDAYFTADNIEALNSLLPQNGHIDFARIARAAYGKFFEEYIKVNPRTLRGRDINRSKLLVGIGFTHFGENFPKEEDNLYYMQTPTAYSDNTSDKTKVVKLNVSDTGSRALLNGIHPLSYEDTLEVAYIENKAFPGDHNNLAGIETELIAASYNEAIKGNRRRNLSLGYFESGRLVGYAIAYIGFDERKKEEIIHISDFAVLHKQGKAAGKILHSLSNSIRRTADQFKKEYGKELRVSLQATMGKDGSYRLFMPLGDDKPSAKLKKETRLKEFGFSISERKKLHNGKVEFILNILLPEAAAKPTPAAKKRKAREEFIDLLHLLNKNWWLDPEKGYKDKEALGFDLVRNAPDENTVMGWTAHEFSDRKYYDSKLNIVERIINHRILLARDGKVRPMSVEDKQEMFRLAQSLGVTITGFTPPTGFGINTNSIYASMFGVGQIKEIIEKHCTQLIAWIKTWLAKRRSPAPDDKRGIKTLHDVILPQDKPVVVVLDVHGTVLTPNWKKVYIEMYYELFGRSPPDYWVRNFIFDKSEEQIIKVLCEQSGKKEREIIKKINDIRIEIWKEETPSALPGIAKLLKSLKKRGVTVILTSGTRSEVILPQLEKAGILDIVPRDHVIGSEVFYKGVFDRVKIIDAVKAQYPDHTIAYLDDAHDTIKRVKDFVVCFGIAQGDNIGEQNQNIKRLKEAGAHYLICNNYENVNRYGKYDWEAIDEILTVPPSVQLKDRKIPVSMHLAEEIVACLPAERNNPIDLLIDISDDLGSITYYSVEDNDISKLTKIITIPSSNLITPQKYIEQSLPAEMRDRLLDALKQNKRYTRYKGITTSWDASIDKDVWTTNIDTVFIIKRMEEMGVFKDPSIKNVIEIGVGGGHVSAALAAKLPNIKELTITDISIYALQAAKRCIEKYLPKACRLRTYIGKGIRTVEGKADLIVVNPPYIPTPAFVAKRYGDAYRGTGLIREILERGIANLNPDNPNAKILMNISSLAKEDLERYKQEFQDRFDIEEVGEALKVPLKITAITDEWKQYFVKKGLLEEKQDAKPDEERYWHTIQMYSITPKKSFTSKISVSNEAPAMAVAQAAAAVPGKSLFSMMPEELANALQRERAMVGEAHASSKPTITVFGSARIPEGHPIYVQGKKIGELVFKAGYLVRTGGGPSMMEAPLAGYIEARERAGVARSLENETQAFSIKLPFEEKPNPYAERNYTCEYFPIRKVGLYEDSVATVVFPGGFGTEDELFEVISRGQPVVLFSKAYWEPIIKEFFDEGKGPFITDSPEEAIEYINRHTRGGRKLSEDTLKKANVEIERELAKLSALVPSVTIFGEAREGSDELGFARDVMDKCVLAGVPVRVGSRGTIFDELAEYAKEHGFLDMLQATLFIPESSHLTENETSLRHIITANDISNYQLLLSENSRAFIFLPGGSQTMNALFSLITQMQTKKAEKRPVLLVGRDFWEPKIKAIVDAANSYEKPLIGGKDTDLFKIVDTIEECTFLLQDMLEPDSTRPVSISSGMISAEAAAFEPAFRMTLPAAHMTYLPNVPLIREFGFFADADVPKITPLTRYELNPDPDVFGKFSVVLIFDIPREHLSGTDPLLFKKDLLHMHIPPEGREKMKKFVRDVSSRSKDIENAMGMPVDEKDWKRFDKVAEKLEALLKCDDEGNLVRIDPALINIHATLAANKDRLDRTAYLKLEEYLAEPGVHAATVALEKPGQDGIVLRNMLFPFGPIIKAIANTQKPFLTELLLLVGIPLVAFLYYSDPPTVWEIIDQIIKWFNSFEMPASLPSGHTMIGAILPIGVSSAIKKAQNTDAADGVAPKEPSPETHDIPFTVKSGDILESSDGFEIEVVNVVPNQKFISFKTGKPNNDEVFICNPSVHKTIEICNDMYVKVENIQDDGTAECTFKIDHSIDIKKKEADYSKSDFDRVSPDGMITELVETTPDENASDNGVTAVANTGEENVSPGNAPDATNNELFERFEPLAASLAHKAANGTDDPGLYMGSAWEGMREVLLMYPPDHPDIDAIMTRRIGERIIDQMRTEGEFSRTDVHYMMRIEEAMTKYNVNGGSNVSDAVISASTGIPEKTVRRLRGLMKKIYLLSSGTDSGIESILEHARTSPNNSARSDIIEMCRDLEDMLESNAGHFTPREILALRNIMEPKPKSRDDMAKVMGVSRSHYMLIRNSAIQKAKKLADSQRDIERSAQAVVKPYRPVSIAPLTNEVRDRHEVNGSSMLMEDSLVARRLKYLLTILDENPEFGQDGFTIKEFIDFLMARQLVSNELFNGSNGRSLYKKIEEPMSYAVDAGLLILTKYVAKYESNMSHTYRRSGNGLAARFIPASTKGRQDPDADNKSTMLMETSIVARRLEYLLNILDKNPEFGNNGFTTNEFAEFLMAKKLASDELFNSSTIHSLYTEIQGTLLYAVDAGLLTVKRYQKQNGGGTSHVYYRSGSALAVRFNNINNSLLVLDKPASSSATSQITSSNSAAAVDVAEDTGVASKGSFPETAEVIRRVIITNLKGIHIKPSTGLLNFVNMTKKEFPGLSVSITNTVNNRKCLFRGTSEIDRLVLIGMLMENGEEVAIAVNGPQDMKTKEGIADVLAEVVGHRNLLEDSRSEEELYAYYRRISLLSAESNKLEKVGRDTDILNAARSAKRMNSTRPEDGLGGVSRHNYKPDAEEPNILPDKDGLADPTGSVTRVSQQPSAQTAKIALADSAAAADDRVSRDRTSADTWLLSLIEQVKIFRANEENARLARIWSRDTEINLNKALESLRKDDAQNALWWFDAELRETQSMIDRAEDENKRSSFERLNNLVYEGKQQILGQRGDDPKSVTIEAPQSAKPASSAAAAANVDEKGVPDSTQKSNKIRQAFDKFRYACKGELQKAKIYVESGDTSGFEQSLDKIYEQCLLLKDDPELGNIIGVSVDDSIMGKMSVVRAEIALRKGTAKDRILQMLEQMNSNLDKLTELNNAGRLSEWERARISSGNLDVSRVLGSPEVGSDRRSSMTGADLNYIATMGNLENDVRGKFKDESSEFIKEMIRAYMVDYAYGQIKAQEGVEETQAIRIWQGYGAKRQQRMMQDVATKTNDRIKFEKSIDELVSFATRPENINKTTVTILPREKLSPDQKKALDDTVKAGAQIIYIDLNKESLSDDELGQIEGLIGVGRAYLNDDEESFYKLYSLLVEKPMTNHALLDKLRKNPDLFIDQLNFILRPIKTHDLNDLPKLNNQLRKLLEFA